MEDEIQAYFLAVEEYFVWRIGGPLILSPEDVEAVTGWWREGIPIEAVQRGIDGHLLRLEANPRRKRRARAVRYCDADVRDAWDDLQAAKLGDRRGEGLEEPARVGRVLERAGAGLREAAARAEGRGAGDLAERMAGGAEEVARMGLSFAGGALGAEALEEALRALDATLLEALRASAAGELEGLREESARRLADVRERMEPKAFERTRDVLAEKLLRERHALPRLSLYSY